MKKISYILSITIVLLFYGYNLWGQQTTAPGPNTTAAPKKIVLLDNDLGSKLNPVKCHGVKGEKDYLDRLRDRAGNPVIYERTGHGGPTAAGHYFDQYLVKTRDGKVCIEIYLDMYCPGNTETQPIKEFQMEPTVASKQAAPRQKSVPPSTKPSQTKKTVPANAGKNRSNLSKGIANSQSQGASKSKPTKKKPGKNSTSRPVPDKIPGFDDVPETSPPPKKKTSPKKSSPPQKTAVTTKTTTTPPAKKPTPTNVGKIPGFDDVPSASPTVKKGTPVLNQTYLSRVPVLEPAPGQPAKKNPTPGIAAIINQSINDSLKTLEKGTTVNLHINQAGHTIHDKEQEIKELYLICSGGKDPQEKMEEITKKILDPRAIDIVITGTIQFKKQAGKYLVTPILIGKPDNKWFDTRVFEYEQKIKQGKIEKGVQAGIVEIIKKEFPQVFSLQAAEPGKTGANNKVQPGKDVYISIIPFFEPGKLAVVKKTSLAKLLEEVVIKEVEAVKNSNSQLEVNDPNHTIHDVKVPINELHTILTQSNLKDGDKADKVINDLMAPRGIDYIFTVIYTEDKRNNIILVRPHVISKKERKIFSMNLIFQKDELLCPGAQAKEIKLCESAGDNIGAALRMLLGQSIK